MPGIDRWQRLKNTTHLNFAFDQSAFDEKLLTELLRWLNDRSVVRASDAQIRAHLDQLQRRRRGLDDFPGIAERLGKDVSFVQVRFMDCYDFVRFDIDGFPVSVDLLNAAGELGFPSQAGEIVEIFATGRGFPETPETPEERERRTQIADHRRRQLIRDLVAAFDVRSVFGGYMSYVSRYVTWLQRVQAKGKPKRLLPWELLWPMTYLRECDLDDAALQTLPVHSAERLGRGALVQVFEDLHMGYEDKYREAAHALGLRTVWDLKL